MNIRHLPAILRMPYLLAQAQINQDYKSFLRLHFLHAAMNSGLLPALKSGASREELLVKLQVKRPELLDTLLELGISLKELSVGKGIYRIKGRRSHALIDDREGIVSALIEEYVGFHASSYRHLPARLRGAALGEYLEEYGVTIARASRILEPFVKSFMQSFIKGNQPLRILEVGCGTGVYLRHAADTSSGTTGIGIDLQEVVVQEAAANMERWGLGERFKIMVADIRNPPATLAGSFDLVTLYNNIYYFIPEERPALFQQLKSLLCDQGVLAIVSEMRGATPAAIDFDLILRSTAGCTPLPDLDETKLQLRRSGFNRIKSVNLFPGESFYGITAKN